MSRLNNEFHVNIPVKATIHFLDYFKGKSSPIFIESLGDRYIVFYSHLGLPETHEGKKVKYMYDFQFLNDIFEMKGIIIRSEKVGGLYRYEGRFDDKNIDRPKLFTLLNRYSVFLHQQKKANKGSGKDKDIKRRSSYFSKRI